MPTNNPKVSAYIPQHIFDRFKQFYQEKDISMSQAVAIIFGEYFQVDLQVDYISGSPKSEVTATRLEALEKEIEDLKFVTNESSCSLLSDLQNLQYLVNQIENRLSEVEVKQVSELKSSLRSELLELPQEDGSVKQLSILETTEHQPEGDHHQPASEEVQLVEGLGLNTNELLIGLLSELQSNPLSTKKLSLRLGVNSSTISHKKRLVSKEEFYRWIQEKDPDGISWEPVEENLKGYSKGWIPASDTPGELLIKLQEWIQSQS